MSQVLNSPGVFQQEVDNTFLQPPFIAAGAVIIGPTVKGKNLVPTVVTSFNQYKTHFGTTFKSGSDYYEYLTSIAAKHYFDQGGNSLIVTKIQSGSWTSAEATVPASGSGTSFTLETLGDGAILNNTSSLTTDNSLESGSKDNIRWEVTSVNYEQGTFNLVIRRGDDNKNNKIILETWTNLSLDPNSNNYIARVIGDQDYTVTSENGEYFIEATGDYPNKSNYVRVKTVNSKTPDFFDNDGNFKAALTGSLPLPGSGSNGGSFNGATGAIVGAANFFENINATDTQGLDVQGGGVVPNYDIVASILENTEEYNFDLIVAPGINRQNHSSTFTSLVTLADSRQNCIFIGDMVPHGANISTVVDQAQSVNSSFSATYWPWVRVNSSELNRDVWVPMSTLLPGVFEFSDRVGAAWFAPAGFLRGGLPSVKAVERNLRRTNRNTLYAGKINPVGTFPKQGIVIYGQKTLQSKPSSLDRINVRRLVIELKDFIGQQANNIVFENNTTALRNRFLSVIRPYLDSIVQRQGLYAYDVIMNENNNTSDVIDRLQLRGAIRIQPTQVAEYIYLDYIIEPTGVIFP